MTRATSIATVRERRAQAPNSGNQTVTGEERKEAEKKEAEKTNAPEVPPHGIMFLPMYAIFGVIASFAFGRELGKLPTGTDPQFLFNEFSYPALVTCAFVVCYSLFDTLGVGRARAKCNHMDATDMTGEVPEELMLALRAQTNQVEQFPTFLAALWSFSFFVSGFGGGVLGGLWVVLRQRYSSTYRNSMGVGMADKGLGKFTLPCYFLVNAMAMGVIVHILRFHVAHK